jgi:hypothetical protein
VITAGSAEQVVFDGGGGGHSVFTAAVLDALRGQADLDGDRVVTFGELYNQVGRTVEMKTERRQTPLQATLPDHEGGCVALFPPGVKPAASTVAERLMALERTAEERLAEIERLSDAVTIRKLRTAADELWPCVPDKVADMTAWLVQAKEIVGRRPVHEDSLLRLRQEAYLKQVLAGTIEEGELAEPVWDEVEPKLRWRYETTQDLVTDLEELAATVTDVEKRLAFARTVREKSVEMYSVEWREAIASIANQKECPAYEGLVMTPQLGLVPLGRDPASGLQEFAHLQTGEIPYRDDEEHLVIDKEMGIVF